MYTEDQLNILRNKLSILKTLKNDMHYMTVGKPNAITINMTNCSNVTVGNAELLNGICKIVSNYLSNRIRTLTDEIDNTIIINPSKL